MIISVLFTTILYYQYYNYSYFKVIIIMITSFFLIGLVDDLIKVKFKDYHGIPSIIRFLLELVLSLICLYYLQEHYLFENINLLNDYKINIGKYIFILFPFILVGCSNSVNLTDGLDGLSSSLYLLAVIPFILFSLIEKEYYLTYLLISSFGATLGFISFNLHPSKIFMGDSGSLSLGLLLGISAIILHKEIFLLISGGLFIFETLSVILQVSFFKLTKKRLFLMAPFHHHLELKGFKEYQIVMYFFIVGLVLSFASIILIILF
ncbi:MAG: phospho-N-acetylmuramoyl-pentapeptide-transferase [Erysipelotrichaceae bacterium]|nr:phospho-N-acetylmuramoyl-pentapeptide-transferase [Erysipelotrichaceae bacterium]